MTRLKPTVNEAKCSPFHQPCPLSASAERVIWINVISATHNHLLFHCLSMHSWSNFQAKCVFLDMLRSSLSLSLLNWRWELKSPSLIEFLCLACAQCLVMVVPFISIFIVILYLLLLNNVWRLLQYISITVNAIGHRVWLPGLKSQHIFLIYVTLNMLPSGISFIR